MCTGSCLCGRVKFEVEGEISDPGSCHCTSCRKSTGSAFAAGGLVNASGFRWVSGADELASYPRADEELHHYFCRNCGSSLVTAAPSAFASEDAISRTVGIHLGCLDEHGRIRLGHHLHVKQKASWYDISDTLPQFDTLPSTS